MVSSDSEGHKIGLLTAISYTVGDIVGSGIFISPTSILNHAGSVGLSLCLWAICAGISLFGALSYVELGTSIRKSGCDFAYLSYFGWRPIASSFMWVSTCLSYPAVLSIQAISFGEYIIAGPLLFLNFFSLKKVVGAFQVVATAVKLIVASVIIFTGLWHILVKQETANFQNSFHGSDWNPGNLVLGVYSGLFAYNGWDVLNFGAEEIENPRRTLPIAAISGISISAIVFILMNVSYFSVLSVEDFKSSPTVAVMSAKIPADVIAKLQKFDDVITKIEDALDEIDVGVDKHYERSAHGMALVDTMSLFMMDSLMWAVQATKGGGADKNDDLLVDLARTKRMTGEMKEINLRQDAPRINQQAAASFVRNALWEVPEEKGDEPVTKKL
uniref:Amino acid permease/ SLC12A domain-containing protein n=1 Tax=Caenorhabditis japonica TaxID=281687 RepID=A0A8R1I3P6_CAEJA